MSASTSIQSQFELAKFEFINSLKDPQKYDFSNFVTIEQVYEETDRIQSEQGRSGTLRGLKKIKPFLEAIRHYSDVVDTFIQVKPELLALIWGPIQLLLQSFDKLINAMRHIGETLPLFQAYGSLFRDNPRVQQVLCIFFRDILDFYATTLNFFSINGWRVFFESLWPRYGKKISHILDNMARHRILMDSEVTLASIEDACHARTRANTEYENMEESRESQRFEMVKLSISPHLYDVRLSSILENCCSGTGDWIGNETNIRQWLDPNNMSLRTLWLIGMPGAGKTHLSSIIIRRLQEQKDHVFFAYLSYRDTNSINKIGILHSLIFQLVFDNKDLRPILCAEYDQSYRSLLSSADFVQSILERLLESIGVNFIVLDGLDEIDQNSRKSILDMFLKISKSCNQTRILFSSRNEVDIAKILKAKAKTVHIGGQNISDIRRYIKDVGGDWLNTLSLKTSESSEIESMLAKIPDKAQGMFLYARLVITNLQGQESLNDVRTEANNLPNGLDEAYGRILTRINNKLHTKERDKARKILEWIGCSLVPLRKEELEHAIIIQDGDTEPHPERKGWKDIQELCGPIIECHDDIVAFVHFSAKEYIFGPQSQHFLSKIEAHRAIASVCMTYLTFDCFRMVKMTDSKISTSILSGDYALQRYAESFWLEHIVRGATQRSELSSFENLCQDISEFAEQLSQNDVDDIAGKSNYFSPELRIFQRDWPEIYDFLSRAHRFRTWQQNEPNIASDCDEMEDRDPLSVSKSSIQIRKQYYALVCKSQRHNSPCHCITLLQYYGPKFHTCNIIACEYYHIGFRTYKGLKDHLLVHSRPYKCSTESCSFADIGFTSQALQQEHESHHHSDQNKHRNNFSDSSFNHAIGDIPISDIDAALLDAVKLGAVDVVRELLQPHHLIDGLLEIAARGKSIAMIELLLDHHGYDPLDSEIDRHIRLPPLHEAIAQGNLEMVDLFLKRNTVTYGRGDGPSSDERLLNTIEFAICKFFDSISCLDIIKLLMKHSKQTTLPIYFYQMVERRIRMQDEDEFLQIKVIPCLGLILDREKNSKCATNWLVYLSRSLQSVAIAKILLQYGADVNGTRTKAGSSTPLYECSGKRTLKAVEYARFLLYSGARPILKKQTSSMRNLEERPLAKAMPGLLGITWEEFIASATSGLDDDEPR